MKTISADDKSYRQFGFLFSFIFLLLGLWRANSSNSEQAIILFVASSVFLFMAWFWTLGLSPFYKIWMKIGHILGIVNTKILLGAVFFLMFTPVAIYLRLFKRNMLAKSSSLNNDSYWAEREKKDFSKSMLNQF